MTDVKEAVRQQFGAVAAHYASSAVHAGGPDLEAMLATAALRGHERVLDAGCGTGHTALAFAPHVAAVTALDLTEEMLAQGRRLAAERGIANVAFQRGDVERLEYPDGSFDVVTSRYSAHHYQHPRQALHEIRRVLKPGGLFLLVDVVAPAEPARDTYLNAVELLRDPSHVRDHSIEEWLRMMSNAGLAGEVMQTWPLRLEFASWVARMNTPPAAVAQIKALADAVARETRDAFAVEPDYSFSVPIALLKGRASGLSPSG